MLYLCSAPLRLSLPGRGDKGWGGGGGGGGGGEGGVDVLPYERYGMLYAITNFGLTSMQVFLAVEISMRAERK